LLRDVAVIHFEFRRVIRRVLQHGLHILCISKYQAEVIGDLEYDLHEF
jgi:hypothetical protein